MRAVRVNSGTVARRWQRALTGIRLEVGVWVGHSLANINQQTGPNLIQRFFSHDRFLSRSVRWPFTCGYLVARGTASPGECVDGPREGAWLSDANPF